jgi:hypothetical protein
MLLPLAAIACSKARLIRAAPFHIITERIGQIHVGFRGVKTELPVAVHHTNSQHEITPVRLRFVAKSDISAVRAAQAACEPDPRTSVAIGSGRGRPHSNPRAEFAVSKCSTHLSLIPEKPDDIYPLSVVRPKYCDALVEIGAP